MGHSGTRFLPKDAGMFLSAQMRAMQLLFPGARLRPRFARAAYAAVRDVWLGDLREVRPSRFGMNPSRDSESYPRRAFGIRD